MYMLHDLHVTVTVTTRLPGSGNTNTVLYAYARTIHTRMYGCTVYPKAGICVYPKAERRITHHPAPFSQRTRFSFSFKHRISRLTRSCLVTRVDNRGRRCCHLDVTSRSKLTDSVALDDGKANESDGEQRPDDRASDGTGAKPAGRESRPTLRSPSPRAQRSPAGTGYLYEN